MGFQFTQFVKFLVALVILSLVAACLYWATGFALNLFGVNEPKITAVTIVVLVMLMIGARMLVNVRQGKMNHNEEAYQRRVALYQRMIELFDSTSDCMSDDSVVDIERELVLWGSSGVIELFRELKTNHSNLNDVVNSPTYEPIIKEMRKDLGVK